MWLTRERRYTRREHSLLVIAEVFGERERMGERNGATP
jgi:hypothetical protein